LKVLEKIMIISKTPLRIGIAGGGSDIPSFCSTKQGFCVNATIDKYVYVLVKKRYDSKIYLKYSENEIVDDISEIKHDFIREALELLDIDFGIEIINWADIPTKGTGLGSSSSFLVGLLNALHVLKGRQVGPQQLAEEACYVEIQKCEKPIGYQDQFAAAFGGLNSMQFKSYPESTCVIPMALSDSELLNVSNHIMMFYTGITRDSGSILSKQSKNISVQGDQHKTMQRNVDIATKLYMDLLDKQIDFIGYAMDENWKLKKTMASGITSKKIDAMYDMAKFHGARGGKITGAGGGGFLIFWVPWSKQSSVRKNLENFCGAKYMPMKIDKYGSRIILNTEEYTWG
jgi:D-glycero-alpha-D-manno-heptose-7-phosphate kinase